jgi:hypothetical protein
MTQPAKGENHLKNNVVLSDVLASKVGEEDEIRLNDSMGTFCFPYESSSERVDQARNARDLARRLLEEGRCDEIEDFIDAPDPKSTLNERYADSTIGTRHGEYDTLEINGVRDLHLLPGGQSIKTKNHDYEPSWDYAVTDLDALIKLGVTQPEHKAPLEAAIEAAKAALLAPMGFDGCDIFFVEPQCFGGALSGGGPPVAIYCNGTSSWPVIGLDLDSIVIGCSDDMQEVLIQIRTSIAHELAHAYQESCGLEHEDGFDEDNAEKFARQWSDTGAIHLWMLDPQAMGTDSVQGFPLKTVGFVFHVGTMDSDQKGATHNRTSLEGNGLSVSIHPKEWTQIARLGGQPTWQLKPLGRYISFLDFHALSAENRDIISAWAVEKGLLRQTKLATITWNDDELGGNVSSTYDIGTPKSLIEARNQFNGYEEGEANWSESYGLVATAILDRRIGFPAPTGGAFAMAATCFVEDVLSTETHVDGVWWAEDLDPGRYSAPRGVISKQSLQNSKWDVKPDGGRLSDDSPAMEEYTSTRPSE